MEKNDDIMKLILQQEQCINSLSRMVDSIEDILQLSQAIFTNMDKIRSKLLENGIYSLLLALNTAIEKQNATIVSLEKSVNSNFIKIILGFLGMSATLIAAALTIIKLFGG